MSNKNHAPVQLIISVVCLYLHFTVMLSMLQLVSDQQKADAPNYFLHSCYHATLPPLSLEEGTSLVLDPTACPQELCCSEQ